MDDLRNRRYKASLPPPQMYLLGSVTFLLARQTNLSSPQIESITSSLKTR